ncbi:hypothetical protein NE237_025205 [Protea cynaroides]|uniref:Uncharacterized protein n=1 Tax=Protea cynaroides TaxID=273540 RepID=A0A9Q0H2N9_9MAGN|nr:hypothetical protein NE237_025205 [Protea cynaroides]
MDLCGEKSPSRVKIKVIWRKLYDYVRYDLKEIAFHRCLIPPHIKKRRKLTLKERLEVLKEATGLYTASWVRYIGPDLRQMITENVKVKMENLMKQRKQLREKNPLHWRILVGNCCLS